MTMSPQTPAAAAPASPPEDLVGTKFLGSVGWALWAVVWGALLGYWVETAIGAAAESRTGAALGAGLFAVSGAVLAFLAGQRFGMKEALGRAVLEAINFSWRGAWLGGLIGGGFAADGVGAILAIELIAIFLGGLVGLGVGAWMHKRVLEKTLNTGLWWALLAGFAAATLCVAPGTPKMPAPPAAPAADAADPDAAPATPDPIQSSPLFGSAADWVWKTAGGSVLGIVAVGMWIRWLGDQKAKEKEKAADWGTAIAALVLMAALGAGAGAVAGVLTQMLLGQMFLGGGLQPTLGKWAGVGLALLFWGLKQQPQRPATQ